MPSCFEHLHFLDNGFLDTFHGIQWFKWKVDSSSMNRLLQQQIKKINTFFQFLCLFCPTSSSGSWNSSKYGWSKASCTLMRDMGSNDKSFSNKSSAMIPCQTNVCLNYTFILTNGRCTGIKLRDRNLFESFQTFNIRLSLQEEYESRMTKLKGDKLTRSLPILLSVSSSGVPST